MATTVRQNHTVTWADLVGFKADTTITQQVGDTVQVVGLGKPGETWIAREIANTPGTADDRFVLQKAVDNGVMFWSTAVSRLVGSANVTIPALADGTEAVIANAVLPGVVAGQGLLVSTLNPAMASMEVTATCIVNGEINLVVRNNSGANVPSPGGVLFLVYNIA